MNKVESPFNIQALRDLIRVQVDPGYEFATMDMVADLLDEQDVGDDIKDNLYPYFDAILFGKEFPEIKEETKRFLQQSRHEIAKRYEILHDLNHPGYLMLKAAIEREGGPGLFRYAMELGCPSAARVLAQQEMHKGHYVEARSNLVWAIEHGDYHAYSDYGSLVYDLEDDDHSLSFSIFKEGLEAGNSECALEIVDRNLCGSDYMPWIEEAKRLHNPRWHSCFAWRLLHEYGKKQQGVDELSAGIEAGDEESIAKMGRVYLFGIQECGIKADLDMAISYTDPIAEKYAEASYVNATAKLKKGIDVVDCLKRLAEIADNPCSNPDLKTMTTLELGKAYFGKYGGEAKETIRSVLKAKTLRMLMPDHTPSMDPMIAMEVIEVINEIQEAMKEESDDE